MRGKGPAALHGRWWRRRKRRPVWADLVDATETVTDRLAELAARYQADAEQARRAQLAALAGIKTPPAVVDRLMTRGAQSRSTPRQRVR